MRGGFRPEFLDRLPHFMRGGIRRHRIAKRNRYRIRYALGPLPEEPATLETEDTAPQPIQKHRYDRHFQALHDLLHAALEWQAVSGAADGPLGEDAHHVTGGQILARRANRRYRIAAAS